MFDTLKYSYKPIDCVRDELIGAKIIDIEPNGHAIHIEKDKREYTIDTTGEKWCVVHAYLTEKEKTRSTERILCALIEKLGITDDELIEIMNGEDD